MSLFLVSSVFAIGRDGFVVNVVQHKEIIKEFSHEVAIPFNSEYEIRLKNTHDRRATARVYIDGVKVSALGDFVIPPKADIDLERFLDRSLTEGKRFKFVPLSHPEVNDPYSSENGIIKVEFRMEKKLPELILSPQYYERYPWGLSNNTLPVEGSTTLGLTETSTLTSFTSDSFNASNTACSAGATIGGSMSDQTFSRIHFDVEDEAVVLTLRMVGR